MIIVTFFLLFLVQCAVIGRSGRGTYAILLGSDLRHPDRRTDLAGEQDAHLFLLHSLCGLELRSAIPLKHINDLLLLNKFIKIILNSY